jgi:hypothetical protein
MKRLVGAVVLGATLGGAVPCAALQYRGDCSNAYTAQLGRFQFVGRLNGSTLRGIVQARRLCPRGRLAAPCTPEVNNSRFCKGTIGRSGRCEVEGYLYGGNFEGNYRCAGDGTPPGGFTGGFSFHR